MISQCLQTITVSNKGVNSVVQLRSGSLVACCADNTVYLFAVDGAEYRQKSKLKIKNEPHTIGYDTKREQLYVGCAWGAIE